MNPAAGTPMWSRLWLLAPLPILLYGLHHYRLGEALSGEYRALIVAWTCIVASLMAAAVVLRNTRIPPVIWPAIAALAVLAMCVRYAALSQLSAGMGLALAAMAAGTLLRGQETGAIRVIAGLALLSALVGWTLPLPVHWRAVYLAVAAALVVLRHRAVWAQLRESALALAGVAGRAPLWSLLVVAAIGVASLSLWLPTVGYDENSVHLVLPGQLLQDGQYAFDVRNRSWAMVPWANNVLHAVAMLLAGGEARSAVAALWLLLGVTGAYRLARALDASPGVALAACAVFASQPLIGYFGMAMQVDAANAALLLHLAAFAVLPAQQRPGPAFLGAVLGLLLALKTSNLAIVVPMFVWLCLSQAAGARLRWLAVCLAMMVPVGASSYVYAWIVTGNPLFPFYNAFFKSPYYPLIDRRDMRWMAGIDWRTLWDVTFHTSRYGEVAAGAAGIALLATLPALLMQSLSDRRIRALLLFSLFAAWLVFGYMQYLRYVLPMLSVLAVLGTVALGKQLGVRVFAPAIAVIVAVNSLLLPTTSWTLQATPWDRYLRDGSQARVLTEQQVMPERVLLRRVLQRDPAACILLSNRKAPFVGVAGGRATSMNKPALRSIRDRLDADVSGALWRQTIAGMQVSHVIVAPDTQKTLPRALAELGYAPVDRLGQLQTWARSDIKHEACDFGLPMPGLF